MAVKAPTRLLNPLYQRFIDLPDTSGGFFCAFVSSGPMESGFCVSVNEW